MKFNVFTLHPRLFDSFVNESLIARAIAHNIIEVDTINWREKYGQGSYKQVDDRPYGGGTGMVLQVPQIYEALLQYNAVSPLFTQSPQSQEHQRNYPRNAEYYDYWQSVRNSGGATPRTLTVSMTPRGYQFDQKIAEWISSEFDTVSVLCGRYEGFDARVGELVDLELSMGPYVTNGGEAPAMVFIEAVSRLLPDFVTKNPSVTHDSFSSSLNHYEEMDEYVNGTRRTNQILEAGDPHGKLRNQPDSKYESENLFKIADYLEKIAPFVEHPHYTRPQTWMNYSVPKTLLDGNHKNIDQWRKS